MAALNPAVGEAADARPLIVHVVYRFAVGGLENGIVNLINHMDPGRWRHAIVALTEVDAGFVTRIQRPDTHCVSLRKPPGQGVYQYPALWRLFRRLRPAIVHTRNLGALECQFPAWLAGVKGRVHSEHGRDADDVNGTNARHILIRRTYRRFTQHQIALGQELRGYLHDKVRVPTADLSTIYNGVDQQRFAPAPSRQPIAGSPFTDPRLWLVGTVGRMQAVKAQTDLARAFVLALQQQPALHERLRLVLVGDGPLRAECQQILTAAGVADLAWLAGERSDVPQVMQGLDAFALPSLVEGISNTILEAMACGLPVLATAVGANPELVSQDETGLLVPAADVSALAAGLLQLANSPDRASAMGRAGRQAVEQRFSLAAMVAGYQGVYDRML